jgi:hypothetical protein
MAQGTCALVAMAGSAACATAKGDGWTDGEGVSAIGVWDGQATRPAIGPGAVGHGAAANERAVGEWARTMSSHAASGLDR